MAGCDLFLFDHHDLRCMIQYAGCLQPAVHICSVQLLRCRRDAEAHRTDPGDPLRCYRDRRSQETRSCYCRYGSGDGRYLRAGITADHGTQYHLSLIQIYRGSGHVDYDRLKDFLDEDAEKCLEKLRNELETISDDKSDTIFEDCIHSIRAKILKKEEDEILMRLSMACLLYTSRLMMTCMTRSRNW